MPSSSIHLQSGSFETLRDAISLVRTEVFIIEQMVPAHMEFDEEDHSCLHVVVFEHNSAIATGRMLNDGHIGRIAVKKAYRNQKIGTMVMRFFIQYATTQQLPELFLGAQLQAMGFYETLGFTAYGEHFLDANIEHTMMRLRL